MKHLISLLTTIVLACGQTLAADCKALQPGMIRAGVELRPEVEPG